jgi:ATP-dependent Clp protease ATP-binding subunit ClpC
LVVMTSNVGSIAIAKGRQSSLGFLTADDKSTSYVGMKAMIMEELKAYFCPELLNRIDEVVVFRPLEKAQVCGLSLFVSSSAVRAWRVVFCPLCL